MFLICCHFGCLQLINTERCVVLDKLAKEQTNKQLVVGRVYDGFDVMMIICMIDLLNGIEGKYLEFKIEFINEKDGFIRIKGCYL